MLADRAEEAAFAAFLERFRGRVEGLERDMGEAWWDANTTGRTGAQARSAKLQKRLTRIYAERDAYAWLKRVEGSAFSPDLARQHRLLLRAFTSCQMDDEVIEELIDLETAVEGDYNSYRACLGQERVSDNCLRDILRESDLSLPRREAWEASKGIGPLVAERVRRLAVLRNQQARRLGFRDHFALALWLQEQDESALFSLLENLAERTDSLWRAYKRDLDRSLARRFGVAENDLRPWHYPDPFFQEAPSGTMNLDAFFAGKRLEEIAAAFYSVIGLPVSDILARSDLYEKEGKSQHAFCIPVGRQGDVRVLCNLTPTERWMSTLLHELGHGVYERYLGADLPFFLREPAHTMATEAVAMLMGRFSRNAAWLHRYAGASAEEARQAETSAREEMRAHLLILVRWCLVMVHFERALYEDPERDLNGLWWDLVERYQQVTRPDERDAPDWAAKNHIALAPVYYHNYLLGEMLASQLLGHVRRVILEGAEDAVLVESGALGRYLRDAVFARGARLPWHALVQEATGRPLDATAFVAGLTPAS